MAGVELATAYVSIVPDTSRLAKELGGTNVANIGTNAGKSIGSSMGGAIASWGVAAAAAGAAAIVAVVGKTVVDGTKAAIAQAESLNKVDVVFGQSAEAVKAFADQGAKSLGMSKLAALDAAGTFGNLLTATGMADDQAAKFSTSMVSLGADLASFNNTSPEEALDALRSGLAGETEPLKRFGVNLNEAILKQKAMELGLSDGKGQLDANTRAQAAYAVIMEQTAKAQGDFARTSDGVANKQKIVAAQWEDIKAKIGTAFIPVVQKVLDIISRIMDRLGGLKFDKMISPAMQAQLNAFKDALASLGEKVMPKIQAAYEDYVKPMLEKAQEAFGKLGAEVLPTLTAAVEYFSAAWPVVWAVLEPIIASITGIISGLIDVVVGVVRAVMAIFRGDWAAAWDAAKQAISGLWDAIKSMPIVKAMTDAFGKVKETIYRLFIMPLNDAIRAVNQLFGTNYRTVSFTISGNTGAMRKSASQIPEFASGGIVTRPTLGIIGEAGPEAVIPLDKMGGMGTTVINFNQPVRTYSEVLRARRDIEMGLVF